MDTRNIRISPYQLILLMVGSRFITSYYYLPEIHTPPANQDVWVGELLSGIYILFFTFPLVYLANKYKTKNLLEYIPCITGIFIGKLFCIMYSIQWAFLCFLELGTLQDFLHTVMLPETPVYATLTLMIFVCSYLVFQGVESIARIAEFFIPLALLAVITFTALLIKDMDFEVFLPILKDSKLWEINYFAFNVSLRYVEILIFAMLFPNLQKPQSAGKIVVSTVTILLIFLLMIVVGPLGVFGVELAKHAAYPLYTYTQFVHTFDFIEHVESFNVIFIFFCVFIKFSIFLYLSSVGFANTFNAKSNKIFIMPICVVLLCVLFFTGILKDVIIDHILSYEVLPYINIIFIVIIPVILLIIYFVRNGIKNNN